MVSGCGGGGKTADPTTAAQTKEAAGSEAAGSEAAGSEAAGSEAAPGEVSEGGSLTIAIPQPHNTFFMPQSTTTGDRFGRTAGFGVLRARRHGGQLLSLAG